MLGTYLQLFCLSMADMHPRAPPDAQHGNEDSIRSRLTFSKYLDQVLEPTLGIRGKEMNMAQLRTPRTQSLLEWLTCFSTKSFT